jgi:beta-lactamase class A
VSVAFNQAPANGVPVLVSETMRAAITQMMQNSDNARADMFMRRFGLATLTSFVRSIGMSNTSLNGYIDCAGQPFNFLTAQDAAHIYEGLTNGTLLTSANVQTLFSMMAGKNYDFSGIWASLQAIINQEAAAKGLSAVQIASFNSAIQLSQKSGGYTLAGTTRIDGNTVYSTGGNCGWIQIPSCDGQRTVSTQYVFAYLGESTVPNATTSNPMANGAEIFRETIRAALAGWSACS